MACAWSNKLSTGTLSLSWLEGVGGGVLDGGASGGKGKVGSKADTPVSLGCVFFEDTLFLVLKGNQNDKTSFW